MALEANGLTAPGARHLCHRDRPAHGHAGGARPVVVSPGAAEVARGRHRRRARGLRPGHRAVTRLRAGTLAARTTAARPRRSRRAPKRRSRWPSTWPRATRPARLAWRACNSRKGKPGEAATALEAVIERAPTLRYAYQVLGTAYRALGRERDAADAVAAGASGEPAWVDPWLDEVGAFRRGFAATLKEATALGGEGRYAEAIALLERLRAERPDDRELLTYLGGVYATAGRIDEARRILEDVLARVARRLRRHHAPGHRPPLRRHATTRPTGWWREPPRCAPATAMPCACAAWWRGVAGSLDDAERWLAEAAAANPHDAKALGWLGTIRLERGRTADALAAFRQALTRDPLLADALVGGTTAAMAAGHARRRGPLAGAGAARGAVASAAGGPGAPARGEEAAMSEVRSCLRAAGASLLGVLLAACGTRAVDASGRTHGARARLRPRRRRGSTTSRRPPASSSRIAQGHAGSTFGCPRSWAAARRSSTWTATATSTPCSCRAARSAAPTPDRGMRSFATTAAGTSPTSRPAAAWPCPATAWAWPPATTTTTATWTSTSPTSAPTCCCRTTARDASPTSRRAAGVAGRRVEHQRHVLRRRRRRRPRPLRHALSRLGAVARAPVLQPHRGRRLLQPEELRRADDRPPLPQQRQRHVHRRLGDGRLRDRPRQRPGRARRRRERRRPRWTSSSPTTARRITCGSTRAAAASPSRRWPAAWPSIRTARRRPAWACTRPTWTTTATTTCS